MTVANDRGTPGRVARNAASLMIAEVLIQGISFVPAVYIARLLGAAHYGQYILALTFAGLFAAVAEFGLKEVLVRQVSRRRDWAARYVLSGLFLRLALGTISLGLTIGAAICAGYPRDTLVLICLAGAMVSLNALNDVFRALFHGFERMEYDGATRVLEKVLAVALGVLLLWAGYGVFGVIVALPLAALVMFFVNWSITVRRFSPVSVGRGDPALCKSLLKASLPLALAAFLLTVRLRIDTLLLSFLTDVETVGLYGAAFSLIAALRMVPFFFNRAIFPVISRTGERDARLLLGMVERSLKYLLLLAIPITVGINLMSDRIIHLIYGAEFAESGPVLAWLSWALLMAFVTTFCGNLVIAVDQQRVVTFATLAGAIAATAMNLTLIPTLGVTGAAVAAVLAEGAVLIVYSYFIRRHIGSVRLYRFVIRPGLAALLMGLVLYLVPGLNLFFSALIGALIYTALVLVTHGLSAEDWALLKEALAPALNR